MKVIDIIKEREVTISFEVFPPKIMDDFEQVRQTSENIARLGPAFMSVTYGAGGGTSKNTVAISRAINDATGVTVLPHITAIASTKAHVSEMVKSYKEHNIQNVMVLRGDVPKDGKREYDYTYASDLVADIKSQYPDICIGGACYPDGHPECAHKDEDIENIKKKVEAGCDFLTTQMFFDNSVYYNYLYRLREHGVMVPVLAGIMPITNPKQVMTSVSLSGTVVPNRFRSIVDKFGSDPVKMQQAGIIYASEQIIDLIANGCGHIHVYTMNKPDIAKGILDALSEING